MAIAEQFSGLNMDQLIGGPLSAAADASTQLANSTAEFINKVGFDAEGRVRTVSFAYQKMSPNEDGTSNLDSMKVDVPMLAIVPIPNLQVDEVNILFDMEVKQSEKSEKSLDVGASLTGSMRIGFIKVSVTGSVSVHQNNTRSSDNSAKYHVDVRATNHGTPEGLARVLDMMAANVAPTLVGSTIKDGNGQSLSESARIKAENLKASRQKINQIQTRLSAAQNRLESSLTQFKKIGSSQQSTYQGSILNLINGAEEDDQKEKYSQAMDEVNQSWNSFLNQASSIVKMISDGNKDATDLSMFALKAITEKGEVSNYSTTETYYNSLSTAQANAIQNQKSVSSIEDELTSANEEYNNMIAGSNSIEKKEEASPVLAPKK